MSIDDRLRHVWRRYRHRRGRRPARPTIWHHPDYRIALESIGLETRRADLVLWALLDQRIIDRKEVARPHRAPYRALAAVHSDTVLAALSSAEAMAPIFGAEPSQIPVTQVATTIRLACGATLSATRRALAGVGPQLNLLGGFHHASPNRAGGFSVVNDIAVAIHAVRAQGFHGRVAVLDLDAHPPDGTADCVAADPEGLGDVWIGSISGSDWGGMDNVDETILTGADDRTYLRALEALLARMPQADLAFVVAGGDVLAGDRFGGLNLTVGGAQMRDERVRRRLGSTPSVWLSAGGYSDDAWRVLYNTAAVLSLYEPKPLPDDYDPLRVRFTRVARELSPPLRSDDLFEDVDIAEALGMRPAGGFRLLGVYTAEWLEHAYYQYGLFAHLERLGYRDFRVDISRGGDGDRLRLFGHAKGQDHVLLEVVLDRVVHERDTYLFVNWLTLRHPLASFSDGRPKLPNQDVPGLGLAREASELLAQMAHRLELAGVSIRPAAFHVAYTARHDFWFADPAREGRFQKLVADLAGDVPLSELTRVIDAGLVTLDGAPYRWEPTLMVSRLDGQRPPPIPCAGRFAVQR